ncbi:MAG: choice-of-anchor J domain-containing protein [Clostridia bacterium]|nr:choice-of-anchor J domain-containing protein [Clostridia bacterium]
MTKKLLSLLVAALMVISLIPAAAFASNSYRAPAPVKDEQVALWNFDETDPLEDGWQFIDADGDGLTWVRNSYVSGNSGSYSIASASYDGGARTPDNWAVTPVIEIPDEETINLRYFVRSYSGIYLETYRIYVGTSDNIEEMTPVTDDLLSDSDTEWHEKTVDLSDYAGQSIYVAFRHYNCTDQWRFFIDDVEVFTGEAGTPEPTPTPPATEPPVSPEPSGNIIAGYYFETDEDVNAWTFIGSTDTNWVSSANNPGGYDYTTYAHEGSMFILSYSFVDYVGAYQADNWAISPAVTLPEGNPSVSFYASNANADYPEPFSVYIGSTADTADMTLLQGDITCPSGYADPWTHYEIDLSDYAGQTIYLAFYDNAYDCYEIWIDQVEFLGESGAEPTAEPDPTAEPEPTPEPPANLIKGCYFEEQAEVDEWTLLDEDGDGNNWYWLAYGINQNTANMAYEGVGNLTSASYLGGALTPDNWAISPEVAIPAAGGSVSMYLGPQDVSWAAEHVAIYVGTGSDVSQYQLLDEFTLDSADYTETLNYKLFEYSLDDYAGQTVSVAIRHFNCTDMFRVNLDQVEFFANEDEPVEPQVIDQIDIINFTEPVWGEAPAYDVSVALGAPYSISYTDWNWEMGLDGDMMGDGEIFDNPDYGYFMFFVITPDDGYTFAENTVIMVNGNPSLVGPNSIEANEIVFATIDFFVEEPAPAPTLDEALNVEGGELHFESEGAYPWIVVNDEESGRLYAMSGNVGVHSSDSILTTTITANAGDVVSFEFQAWGEGTSTFWDYCEFAIDGERAGYWGAYQNDWELFASEPLTAGEHTLTWTYHKDSSVNPNGDYFMVDNVEITEGELPPSGILGDVDMDGQVTTADALMALRYVMGLIELNEDQLAQADVTGDGEVTVADPLLILRHAMGLIETFPAEEE